MRALRARAGTLRGAPLLALALLFVATTASAQQPFETLNRLRTTGCGDAAPASALKADARLDAVAASLLAGRELAAGLKSAGYRATRSTYIHLTGATDDAALAAVIRRSYCARLADPTLTEIGVQREDGKLALVFAAPFAPAVAQGEKEAGERVLALVNEARRTPRRCGEASFPATGPVRWNDTLASAALRHAEDMAANNYSAHEGRNGSTPAQRVIAAGYRYRMTGENIAAGPSRAEDAVAGWIKSPPHCANLMNAAFTEMGVAYAIDARSEFGVYWAQSFGTPR